MPRVTNRIKKDEPKQKTTKMFRCRKCETEMLASSDNFYTATNLMIDKNGYMSVCKKCCNDLFDEYFTVYNNFEGALRAVCEALDISFNYDALQYTQTQIEKKMSNNSSAGSVLGTYKSKLSSMCKLNTGIDSFRYKDSDYLDRNISKIYEEFIPTAELVKFWGNNLTSEEYEFLSDKYMEYISAYECETPVMEELFKQASFETLEIKVKREQRGDVSKNLKNLQDILSSANIKPNQETGANAADQITFGTLIRKWETEEPVPQTLDDEMKKYIDLYMVGQLAKMQGLNCDLVDEYEKELSEHAININDDEDGDD